MHIEQPASHVIAQKHILQEVFANEVLSNASKSRSIYPAQKYQPSTNETKKYIASLIQRSESNGTTVHDIYDNEILQKTVQKNYSNLSVEPDYNIEFKFPGIKGRSDSIKTTCDDIFYAKSMTTRQQIVDLMKDTSQTPGRRMAAASVYKNYLVGDLIINRISLKDSYREMKTEADSEGIYINCPIFKLNWHWNKNAKRT